MKLSMEEVMGKNTNLINRIIAMALAFIMLVAFLPDVDGMTSVYANEKAAGISVEESTDDEEEDLGEVKSRPDFDVVHFRLYDTNGNKISAFVEDVIEIKYDEALVKRVTDGFEFEEANANEITFTVTVRSEYEEAYRLISVGDVQVEDDSKSAIVSVSDMDEQDIPVVLESYEYGVSSQVNIGGVKYEIVNAEGKSLEDTQVYFGNDFVFKLKNGKKLYNDSVDVIVSEKSGDKLYEITPDRSNLYTIDGELVRGNIKISKEITVGYGNVRYTGGLHRGDYNVTLSVDDVSLVSVPVKAGEEAKQYDVLSVPEGEYKIQLKSAFAEKYKLVEPGKIYKVIKDKTTDIDAAIEPADGLNRFNVYFESDLKIVNISTAGDVIYSEINDDADLAYSSFEVGGEYNKFSAYDATNEITIDISIAEAFAESYEIKSVKYKESGDEVEKDAETGLYVLKKNADVIVIAGNTLPATTGEFGVKIDNASAKYIEIDSIKNSKADDAQGLVLGENEKYQITEGTEHIYIDVKSKDTNSVSLESIGLKINDVYPQAVVKDYDYENDIMHLTLDTVSLKDKEIEFFVEVCPLIVFDDNVMKPSFQNYGINISYGDDANRREVDSILQGDEYKDLNENFYVYNFTGAEALSIGETLNVSIGGREDNKYLRDYIGKDNITYYYQVFGDKTGKKYEIANPDLFQITLDQTNPIIVFTYESRMIDRVYVDNTEVYDMTVNLDSGSQVKIMSTGMASNLSHLNIKDPSTASWKINCLTKKKSDELLTICKNDAVYFDVNDDAIKAIGYKPFVIERIENGQKTTWNFVINNEKPVVEVKNLDKKTIYAGQEKAFAYVVKGSNHVLTKDNVKIYAANGEPATEANIKVKDVSASDITIAVAAEDAATDKATYYIDVVNLAGDSLLKNEKKYKLNVDVLDSKFAAKNIEYVRSDEDSIYFRIKGLTSETESLYTSVVVSAKAVLADGETLNELYKNESVVEGVFKNDTIIKVPVKVDSADERDNKSTSQDYSFTFRLQQEKTDESGVYKYAEVKLAAKYSNRALYYETNLKVKALPASKNVYTGQRDIQIATPVFSKESSNTSIIYLEDNKGEIETNNYGDIEGNAYDPESGKLVINIPASVTPGKHILTFETCAPNGCIASKASISINVKIGIESVSMVKSLYTYYLGNKDINIKPSTHYYNITHAPMYESTIKPSTCKAIYRVESDNEYLLPYITINPVNGKVKISKSLTKVFDRIKSMGTTFRIVATANDYQGTEVYKKTNPAYSSREDKWMIEITTDGVSDYLKNNNEMRAFLGHSYYDESHQLKVSETPTDVAIIDKNNKKRTQFTIQEANNLTFRVYRSASDTDDSIVHSNITWKVSGPVLSYGADNYGLHIHKVKPGIVTVTAVAADGSGKGSISRTFEVKKDDYKLRLVDAAYGNILIPTDVSYDNENYAFQGAIYMILPFNDAETEMIIEEPYQDHADDVEHNYKVSISGGTNLQLKRGEISWIPTDNYTKITIINNNKGSDGKKVQEDKVYTIHNTCFDRTESAFDNVKVLPATAIANKYYDGKKAAKVRFEVTNLPASVKDIGGGHTGYFLTVAKNYKEKSKFPNPEFDNMIAEVPCSSEIMFENGKYYAELHQDMGEEWWQEPSDFVTGTYKLEAFIGRGDITEENIQYVLNKKMIETTVTIIPNNLKANWEGGKTTQMRLNGNEMDQTVHLVVSAESLNRDTEFFKWNKNKSVAEVRLTGIAYDVDTLNIFKESLISGDNLFAVSSENGNIDFVYKAEDFAALKNAVVNAASGKTVKMKTSAQKAAAKMAPKPDKNGNYNMDKVKPVIRGSFTYEIVGTDATGYDSISNLTQKFEITLIN